MATCSTRIGPVSYTHLDVYKRQTAYFPEHYGDYLIPAIIKMVNGEKVEGPILVEHVAITKDTIDQWYPEQ